MLILVSVMHYSLQNTSWFGTDSPRPTFDSVVDAQRHLYEALLKVKPQSVRDVLQVHPELVHHHYNEKDGYSGTPLLIACNRFKERELLGPRHYPGVYCKKQ